MSQCGIPSKLPRKVHKTLHEQYAFGGLSDMAGATGDKCRSMRNISPCSYPALSARQGWIRYFKMVPDTHSPHGLICHEGEIYIAAGEGLYLVEGSGWRYVAPLADSDKQMVSMDGKIIIFPDAVVYDPKEETCHALALSVSVTSGVSFAGNILTCTGKDWQAQGFHVGDAIKLTIDTALTDVKEKAHYIIRQISGEDLILDRDITGRGYSVTVERHVPNLRDICVWQNRLWGYDGTYLYASAVHHPYAWILLEEVDEDWGDILTDKDAPVCISSATTGEFEAFAVWQDYLVLFKEDRVCKLLGNGNGLYHLSELSAVGVAHGEGRSLCEVAGKLYYLSGHGIFCYDGGYPVATINIPHVDISEAVGGSDGKTYYLCAKNDWGMRTLYAYDPENHGWFTQEYVPVMWMVRQNHMLWMLSLYGELIRTQGKWGIDTSWINGSATDFALYAEVIFCDEVGCIMEGMRMHQLYLSCQSSAGSELHVYISYDGEDTYHEVATIEGATDGWISIPLPKVRCQYYHLKLNIRGDFRVYALHRAYEKGGQY